MNQKTPIKKQEYESARKKAFFISTTNITQEVFYIRRNNQEITYVREGNKYFITKIIDY